MKKDQKNKKHALRVSGETICLLSASQLAQAAAGDSFYNNGGSNNTCRPDLCRTN